MTVAEAVVVAELVAVVAIATEAPPGARAGAATPAEAGMAATTAAREEGEEGMKVVVTVVGEEAPARAAVGKGGHGHYSSGAHHSSSFGISSSSSSENSNRVPDVTVVRAKRQVVPSLVGVASSAESLGRLTIADDCAKPVSSNVAHARSAAIEADAAAAEAKHVSSVKRLDATTPIKGIDRVSTLPFSSSMNQSEAA